jgi:hypothetical protein
MLWRVHILTARSIIRDEIIDRDTSPKRSWVILQFIYGTVERLLFAHILRHPPANFHSGRGGVEQEASISFLPYLLLLLAATTNAF